MALNQIAIFGRMTRDPEKRVTQSGTTVTSFTLACDRDYKPQGGEKETDFIDCVIFGRFGEVMAEHLTKGSKVCICGKLTQSRWVDDEDNLHSRIQVVVDDLELMRKTDTEDEPKPSKKKSYSRR